MSKSEVNTTSQKICQMFSNLNEDIDLELLGHLIQNRDQLNPEPVLDTHIVNSKDLINYELIDGLRYYPVIVGHLYAGGIPSSVDDDEFFKKLEVLKSLGISKTINLTEATEQNFDGVPLRDYETNLKALYEKAGLSMDCLRMSIVDLDIPSKNHMNDILHTIDNALLSGEKVYVHCWGGIGRTGTVIACYLINKGILSPDTAINYIAFLKRNTEIKRRDSPETKTQCEFVLNWT